MIKKALKNRFILLLFLFQFLAPICHAESIMCNSYNRIAKLSNDTNIAIHTYGGGKLLETVFNTVSLLMYGKDKSIFQGIIRIALVIGGFAVTCLALLQGRAEPIIRSFFLPALGITTFLLVPKTDVYIQDHLISKSYGATTSSFIKVSNVPYILGTVASIASSMSYYLTHALETVSHGTNDEPYNWTGHIYAADSLFKARKSRIASKLVEDNFREFCRECAWRDISLGLYSKDALINEKDLLTFLENNTSHIRTVRYKSVTEPPKEIDNNTTATSKELAIKGSFIPCYQAIKNIKKHLNSKEGNAKQILLGELTSDTAYLLDQSRKSGLDLKNLIKQQAAIDILQDEMPGTLNSFASKRAELLQRENQKILGALGANSIIAMRNFFEATMYMIFPLIIVISLLSFGVKPILSWLQFILWVNIWPSFYVIVNLSLSAIWNMKRNNLFSQTVDVTIFTSEGLTDMYNSMESIAAIAMAFIPFISWALIKGGVDQMVHLASSLMSPAQSASSTASSEKVTGNYNYGNVSLGNVHSHNQEAFKQSFSGHLSQGSVSLDSGSESMVYSMGDNRAYIKQSDSQLREGISKTTAFNSSIQNQLLSSEIAIGEQSVHTANSLADSSNKTVGLFEALSKNSQIGNSFNQQTSSGLQKSYQDAVNTVNEYSKTHGVSHDTAIREMVEIGFNGNLGVIKGGVQGSMQNGISESNSDAMAERASQSKNFMTLVQDISSYSESEFGTLLNSQDLKTQKDFVQSWNETFSSAEQLRAAHSKQESLSHLESHVQSDNLAVHQSLNQRFVDFLSKEFNNDTGLVSQALDMPSDNPYKQRLIDRFVESFVPASVSPTSISDAYSSYRNSTRYDELEPMREGIEKSREAATPPQDIEVEERLANLRSNRSFYKDKFDSPEESLEKSWKQTALGINLQLDKSMSSHAVENLVVPNAIFKTLDTLTEKQASTALNEQNQGLKNQIEKKLQNENIHQNPHAVQWSEMNKFAQGPSIHIYTEESQ